MLSIIGWVAKRDWREISRKGMSAFMSNELKGYQRTYLRGLAHSLKPALRIGRSGTTAELLTRLDGALEAQELIKVAMHKPADKKALARELADKSGAQLAGLVGHTAILYRPREEQPAIVLPQRGAAAEVDEEA